MSKYFIPEETYDKAIREGETGVLKALLIGVIGSDPTFITTEFDEALEYIKNKSIEFSGKEIILTEQYQRQEDEYEKEESEWDDHYFQMNLVWLRDNFCLSERLPLIVQIGKKVYKNKKTLGKSKAESRIQANSESLINKPVDFDSKKDQAVRTAGGGWNKKGRSSQSIYDSLKDYWWALIIIIVLVVGLIKILGKN